MKKFSLDKEQIKVLLLEGIHDRARQYFINQGYTNVVSISTALDGDELIAQIQDAHIVGIRSRTQLTDQVLEQARKLFAIGCFSIGTNNVDEQYAKMAGIPVFNAPFSSTRSVAELVIAESIMLMRGIPEKNAAAHTGRWLKTPKNAREIRGKNLGLIGYGHIASQVSILAEALGMNVFYYDIERKLSLGKAQACASLDELLAVADIVSLHVPETDQTKNMISTAQLAKMKKGSYLINAARGTVVDCEAVADALKKGHLLGAAFDVFPEEPASNDDEFVNVLRSFDNVLLTPHIGGSTMEAQENIGTEVAEKLVKYSDTGATIGSTNFVEVALQPNRNKQRFLHIHRNLPGVMREVGQVFSSRNINVAAQFLQTDPEIGYVIIDTDSEFDDSVLKELRAVQHTIRARMLY